MSDSAIKYGDIVHLPWGLTGDVAGTVQEVYGSPLRRHVVVLLTPEVSGPVVEEPTTVSVPLSVVRPVSPV
jgi:hypothetical protein